MSRVVRTSTSPDYTASLAAGLSSILRGGDTIRMEGELGAGKTTFIRGLARSLGVPEGSISSPTFVLAHVYPVTGHPTLKRLVHVDAYRLRSAEDLEALGWDQWTLPGGRAAADVALVVEWPERIGDGLGKRSECFEVQLRHVAEQSRGIEVVWPPDVDARPGARELVEREPIRCPITGVWVEPTRSTYPFAGEKERLADLNRWFTGGYRIGRPATQADFEREPSPGGETDNN
ncbi:MAG: tRNA (adenosine(37)-N6)-threonylcarbamoyltransferase complex ATPase subunit type 1 TsaE [Phycisphaerales bacterium]